MSVSQMSKDLKCCATLFPNCFVIQDLSSGMVREIGKEEEGLYTMYSQAGNKKKGLEKCFAVSHEAYAIIWHQKLCHVPTKVLKRIPMFQDFNKNNSFTLNNCEICPLARQTSFSI
ncbi:hypothetical protein AABB24_007644 [Solanum stoloniferum]|uniref:GAG-pre-integrase domain-containing protein n=1 Tax=Solanum stoloniferum TaxID=62892 RepID=A0ABD2UQC8_9SOLN